MRKVLLIFLCFLGGAIVTYLAVVAGLLWHAQLNQIVDRDGGMTMGIIFIIGPIAAAHGGLIAALVIPAWLRRRNRWPSAAAASKPWTPKTRAIVAAAISGVAAFAVAWLATRIPEMSFRSYGAALVVSLSPYGFGFAAAAIAAMLVLRNAQRHNP
jgi:hypothetical protein